MNGCLTLIPNSLTRFNAFFKEIPVVTDDFARYLRELVVMGFNDFNVRADDLLKKIGTAGVTFMKNNKIGFKFIVFRGSWGNTDIFSPLGSRICRGSFSEIKNFIFFYSMKDSDKLKHLRSVIQILQENSRYVFDPAEAKRLTGIDVPASLNGLAPDYRKLTETIYNKFDIFYANSRKNADIKIQLTGIREYDEIAANAAAGIIGGTPELYVWHHLDDFDPITGNCTMQLILKEFHNKAIYGTAFDHTGGVAVWRKFYEVLYK